MSSGSTHLRANPSPTSDGAMTEFEHVSLGEVYRAVQRIEILVNAQNGRVRKLEEDAVRMKTVWAVGVVIVPIVIDWLKHKVVGW